MDSQEPGPFQSKISLMMFAFGDSQPPNPETVALVESTVQHQLRLIVSEAVQRMEPSAKAVRGQDIVFLLRHSKHRMRRLLRFLQLKEATTHLKDVKPNFPEEFFDEFNEKGKGRLIYNFVESIDEMGELTALKADDAIKQDRELRADRTSQLLNEKEYIDFHKARCISFGGNDTSKPKFLNWIIPNNDVTLNPQAVEILMYLAYETVAEMTDLALNIRQDNKLLLGDPLQMLSGSYCNTAMFNAPHAQDSKSFRLPSGQPAITVAEMREVIRRTYMPQVGFMPFSLKSSQKRRFFAC